MIDRTATVDCAAEAFESRAWSVVSGVMVIGNLPVGVVIPPVPWACGADRERVRS